MTEVLPRETDSFSLEKQTHLKFGSVTILEQGPLRATLGASLNIGQSSMEVEVSYTQVLSGCKLIPLLPVDFTRRDRW